MLSRAGSGDGEASWAALLECDVPKNGTWQSSEQMHTLEMQSCVATLGCSQWGYRETLEPVLMLHLARGTLTRKGLQLAEPAAWRQR